MAFFDTFIEHPPTRVGWWLMRRLNRHHLEVLERLLPDRVRVVEVGPGVGAFARICSEETLQYLAVEPNPKICAELRAAGLEVLSGLVPPLPLTDGSVDVVHAAHVIEHCPTFREAMAFVAESRRVVRPRGLVSLVAPDFDHLGNEFFKTHYSHSLPINLRRLTQLMSDHDLVIRHASYLSGPVHGRLRYLSQMLARLSTARLIWLATVGRLSMYQSYAAKMTFMRSVWVVGQRKDA